MSEIHANRVIGTITKNETFRLRALIYHLADEGNDLSSIVKLIGHEYQLADIERLYIRRNELPKYMRHDGR